MLFGFVLFVVIPAYVFKGNQEEFWSFDRAGFLFLALIGFVVLIALTAIHHAQLRLIGRPFVWIVVEFVTFFIIVTGLVLPLSTPIDLVLAYLVAAFMLALSASRFRQSLYLGLVAFVAINAALTFPAIATTTPSTASPMPPVSGQRNIFVLSLDGIPGPAVLAAIEDDPSLAQAFTGFTFYDRVASSSLATSASTMTSLYGNRDFKAEFATVKAAWASQPDMLLTNRLDDNGYRVSTFGIYNHAFHDPSRSHTALTARASPGAGFLLNLALARSLTSLSTVDARSIDQMESGFDAALADTFDLDQPSRNEFAASYAPGWKRYLLTPDVNDFEAYLEQLAVEDVGPTAHFLHFNHTHFPVEFDRDCAFRANDETWFREHENWAGVEDLTVCALKQLTAFVDRLKELGVYDQSLIVLKSDHGKPTRYGDPGSFEAMEIRGSPDWGYGRYEAFLAIKDVGAAGRPASHDRRPVMLDDLARTICTHAEIAVSCDDYGGYDLLGPLDGIEDSEVTLFVVRSADSPSSYDALESVTIRRGDNVVTSLFEALEGHPFESVARVVES